MINRSQNNLKYHEEMKQLCIAVYSKEGKSDIYDYKFINSEENQSGGFHANVYKKGNDIVIVYEGTNIKSLTDIKNDIAMMRSEIPAQSKYAIEVYNKYKAEYNDCNIIVTGHSLGGSLAQIVAAVKGTEAVTFNAYGVGNMFDSIAGLKTSNITNYVNKKDQIGMANAENNLGETYTVPKTKINR